MISEIRTLRNWPAPLASVLRTTLAPEPSSGIAEQPREWPAQPWWMLSGPSP